MNPAQLCGWLAGALSLAGYVPYVASVARGTIAPSFVAWLVWSLEYGVLFVALAAMGAGWGLWLPGAQLAGTVTVCAALGIRRRGGSWREARWALGWCGGALLAWRMWGGPVGALLVLLGVEGYGMAVTAWRSLRSPLDERPEAWTLWAVAGVAGLVAAGSDPVNWVYPVYVTVWGAVVLAAMFAGERRCCS